MPKQEMTPSDIMKFIVLGISSGAFMISVVAKILTPARSDIRDATTAFIIIAGLIFGANLINLIKK